MKRKWKVMVAYIKANLFGIRRGLAQVDTVHDDGRLVLLRVFPILQPKEVHVFYYDTSSELARIFVEMEGKRRRSVFRKECLFN